MGTLWEVKCYRCSRVCGLIIAKTTPVALLSTARGVRKAPLCGLTEEKGPRCSHCGGQLYTEECRDPYLPEILETYGFN